VGYFRRGIRELLSSGALLHSRIIQIGITTDHIAPLRVQELWGKVQAVKKEKSDVVEALILKSRDLDWSNQRIFDLEGDKKTLVDKNTTLKEKVGRHDAYVKEHETPTSLAKDLAEARESNEKFEDKN
jgi:hypothetical protein